MDVVFDDDLYVEFYVDDVGNNYEIYDGGYDWVVECGNDFWERFFVIFD